MTVLVEVIVDRGMGGGELYACAYAQNGQRQDCGI